MWVGRDVDWQWVHGRRVRPVPGGIEPVATSGWPQTFLRQFLGRDRLSNLQLRLVAVADHQRAFMPRSPLRMPCGDP